MKGVERDLLELSVRALRKAYEEVGSMDCEFAVSPVGGGKSDTFGLDWMPETAIKEVVGDYDKRGIMLVTEESGAVCDRSSDTDRTETVFICDPTDESVRMREFITDVLNENFDYSKKPVHEILKPDAWEKRMGGPASVTGALASITAIRNGQVIFNAMVNYVTGEFFVANSLGTKRGTIADGCKETGMADVVFSSDRQGHKFVAFTKKEGYPEHLKHCNLGLDQVNCMDKYTVGPHRILHLSDMGDRDVSFILSNGEKICEWIGWLSWARYAKDPLQNDESSLRVFRLFFENPGTKNFALMAPGPSYSIFRDRDGVTFVDTQRMFQMENPSQYRETLLVVPRHNLDVLSRVGALGRYKAELVFDWL
jgi:hypothetical protein